MRSLSLWVRRTLIVLLLAPLVLGMGFNEQAFECENAVAHMEECCRTFNGTPALCPQPFSCGGGPNVAQTTLQLVKAGEAIAIPEADFRSAGRSWNELQRTETSCTQANTLALLYVLLLSELRTLVQIADGPGGIETHVAEI